MKNIFYALLACCCFPMFAEAQDANKQDTIPSFLLNSHLPEFNIKALHFDSTEITVEGLNTLQLPANTPIVLIYFNPDCGHCQIEAKNISTNKDAYSNAYFVWIDYDDTVEHLKQFAEKYGLANMKNAMICKLTKYDLPVYFQVRFTPYIAIYNRQRKFVTEYRMGTTPAQLAEVLKPL